MSAELWAFLTSAPFLTLLGSVGVAVVGFFASRSTSRASMDEIRDKAMRTAYDVGDEIRDELRADLKEAKAEVRGYIEKLATLERELAAAKRHIETVERMRCPRIDCPVFIRPG